MKFFNAFAAITVAGICLIASKAAHAKDYQCAPFGDETKVPCQVWVNGNEVSVGGFQAAPIFKMQSSWKAINHRGEVVKVMKGPDYTMFLNPATNSSLRIYGFAY